MSEKALSSGRIVRRLAEGVRRTRLLEPVVGSRPSLVVISAPSGYGKSVLAAQLSVSGAYEETVWVDGLGSRGTLAQALNALSRRFGADGAPPDAAMCVDDATHVCAEGLRNRTGDATLLVVLDGLEAFSAQDDLPRLAELSLEAPIGSTLVVATKNEVSAAIPAGVWLIDASALRLDEDETLTLWGTFWSDAKAADAAALRVASGGHAALASLIARRAALLGGAVHLGSIDTPTSGLICALASSQLSDTELTVLRMAAVLGSGAISTLGACLPGVDVGHALTRVAEVMPLVSCGGSGAVQHFTVNSLVCAALGGVPELASTDAGAFRLLQGELIRSAQLDRALALAMDSASSSLLAEALREVGLSVVSESDPTLVRDALTGLPAAELAGDPLLLLLAAESAWHEGEPVRALRTARLALRMAQSGEDNRTARKAQLAVARLRIALGDYEAIADELGPLVQNWGSVDDLGDLGSLVSSAQVAYAFAGDRDRLASCQEIANLLRTSAEDRGSFLARLDDTDGLTAALLDGDFLRSFRKFTSSASRVGLGVRHRVAAANNSASAALYAGLLSEASNRAESGLTYAAGRHCDEAVIASLESTRAVARAISGVETVPLSAVESAVDCETSGGDRFGLASALTFSAMELLAFDERAAASAYAERAVSAAIDTGSPVITWLAELVQGFCCLAVDDVERARSIATRVLPQVEAIAAMGHVLHARMILAEVAMRDADLAAAVGHLSAVSDYIVEKSPALFVACYLRTFPDLMGALVLAMGIDAVPIRVLNLVNGEYEARCLEAASAVLTAAESAQLRTRMGREAERAAAREPEVPEPGICEVRLLGGLQVRTPLGPVREAVWVKRKARIIFAMLVSRCGTDMARGEIIEQLWPEMDEKRGLSNFYVVWSAMKRALQPKGTDLGPFVEHARGVCRLVPGSVVSDLDLFRAASSRARTARASGDSGAELRALLEMVELYRGELLPGDVYTDWFGPVRERFKQDYEAAALRAGYLSGEAGLPHDGLAILRNAVTRNPWREDLYQEIMRLEIATEQRAAAIETYFMCRSRLVEDLGIDPSKETVALYEQVLGMA